MPLYEYHCQGCGKAFERIRTFKERDAVSCPDCGANADRKPSTFSFSFGWDLDDSSHLPGAPDKFVRNV